MIALQSLKYKIFEWCLDTFMNKLTNNLLINIPNGSEVKVSELYKGMMLNQIICNNYTESSIFYKCEIVHIYHIEYSYSHENDMYEIEFIFDNRYPVKIGNTYKNYISNRMMRIIDANNPHYRFFL